MAPKALVVALVIYERLPQSGHQRLAATGRHYWFVHCR